MPRLPFFVFCFLIVFSCGAGEPAAEAVVPPSNTDAIVSEGRAAFQRREYAQALTSFEKALKIDPGDRATQFLAGLAAYWAREPRKALDYFTTLLDKAARDSEEEWRLESSRVMALSALGEIQAAELVVMRLHDLARKLPQGAGSPGFVREHFFLNAAEGEKVQRFRVGVWEVIDLRGEAPDLWTFPVVSLEEKEDRVVKTMRVEVTTLPTGGRGFAFSEGDGASKLVYKYWVQRPEYDAVRVVARQVLVGELPPLKEAGPGTVTEGAKPVAPAPEPTVRVFTQKELAAAGHISRWGLPPTSALILTVAARLKDVDFDVTQLTRAALNDPADADRMLADLKKKHPFAAEDAAELVDVMSRAKVRDLNTMAENLPKLGPRKGYLDYALLTAYNTRGADVPVFFLKETLQSPDALVRQTAALLLARYGERTALELLFTELQSADAVGCKMIQGWLEELIGPELGVPPPATRDNNPEPLQKWKAKAAEWWRQNAILLKHTREPKAGGLYWGK